jgi:hypothetical protein
MLSLSPIVSQPVKIFSNVQKLRQWVEDILETGEGGSLFQGLSKGTLPPFSRPNDSVYWVQGIHPSLFQALIKACP